VVKRKKIQRESHFKKTMSRKNKEFYNFGQGVKKVLDIVMKEYIFLKCILTVEDVHIENKRLIDK